MGTLCVGEPALDYQVDCGELSSHDEFLGTAARANHTKALTFPQVVHRVCSEHVYISYAFRGVESRTCGRCRPFGPGSVPSPRQVRRTCTEGS